MVETEARHVQIAHLYLVTGKSEYLFFNTLCRFFIAFIPSKQQVSFNFVAAVNAKTRGFHTQLDEGPETP